MLYKHDAWVRVGLGRLDVFIFTCLQSGASLSCGSLRISITAYQHYVGLSDLAGDSHQVDFGGDRANVVQ